MKRTKLAQLIIYIANKSMNDPYFGVTKLNKILFPIDFFSYGICGESITNAKYIHLAKGPAPKDMQNVLKDLQQSGKIKLEEKRVFNFKQKRVVPLVNPDLSVFSIAELEFVDYILGRLEEYTATNLSDWTHTLRPWLSTLPNEEIPYESVFVWENLPIEREGILWAKQELKRLRKHEGYGF